MALFLGAGGEDILSWRNVAAIVGNLHESLALERSTMLAGQELPLLQDLKGLLEEEIAFDQQFSARFASTLGALDVAGVDLSPVRDRLSRLAIEHFERRGSVVAFHALCNAMQERLIFRALQLAEEWMVLHGVGSPPGRYCWLVMGCLGRKEGTAYSDCESLLVFDEGADLPSYFSEFARKAEELLVQLGLHSRIRQGSIAEWRSRVSEGLVSEQKSEELAVLMELADLSLLCGHRSLADEMHNMVRGMLSFHFGTLRFMGKVASEMSTGLDFFGRLRVEKNGMLRGMFNIEQYALEPLIKNIRILSIKYGVTATSTVERIKATVEQGPMSVDLAERLLLAFHEFNSHKIRLENKTGGEETFLDPEQLSEREERSLKAGLDAVVNLQRIVYQSFSDFSE